MFKIFSTYICSIDIYIKCNVQRLAVRYDPYKGLGVKGLNCRIISRMWCSCTENAQHWLRPRQLASTIRKTALFEMCPNQPTALTGKLLFFFFFQKSYITSTRSTNFTILYKPEVHNSRAPGRPNDYAVYVGVENLWFLSTEPASRHPSETCNFEVVQ